MDLSTNVNKIMPFIKKYKFSILILLLGLAFMLIPSTKKPASTENLAYTQVMNEESTDEKLAQILSQIRGAGAVKVMLTELKGEEIIFQADGTLSNKNESYSEKTTTIIVTDSDRKQTGLIRQVIPPSYRGAIILCEGADDPGVKLAVVEAVSRILGIGANNISVLKMN